MIHKKLRFGKGFSPALKNERAQVATMVLEPGKSEGGPDNWHRGSDQWLYVVSGVGEAVVAARTYELRAGSLLLIEHGHPHQIKNVGRALLRTLNFYAPPAYTKKGDELRAGRK